MKFDRFINLIGEENFESVKNLKVFVVGTGGVGGYVVESLVRCGVENIIIIDPDAVEETNINRQIIATEKTIGKSKVDVFKERILDINKNCKVTAITDALTEETEHYLHELDYNYLVDACDDVQAKKMMLRFVESHDINFIASMGTGKRLDPSKLEITRLDKTSGDRLARILRKYAKDNNLKKKITVLCSKEVPVKTKHKTITSCSFVPSSAGLLITSHIINTTIDKERIDC